MGDVRIPPADKVRSLGLLLDANMTMVPQVSNCVRSSVYHLRNINIIRQHLNSKAAQQVVHAFVTSRIDMYNSIYFGLPNLQIYRIQKVLNAAARMITRQRLSDHITPTLQQLHWLPVKQRIVFKVLTLTFKALSGECPAYLADLIKVQQTRRTGLRSGDRKN